MTTRAKVMGIINLNDDSFVEESRVNGSDAIKARIKEMLENGADIIDIGAVSSRPGSSPVSAEEEWSRLEPALDVIAGNFKGYSFSIDTFRASIVVMAYQKIGRFTVNDISSGEWDEAMIPLVGRLSLRYIAMHHQGTFETMHNAYTYPEGIVTAVSDYFKAFKERADEAGIENWILDPGFGFSKSPEDNITLLKGLNQLKIFRRPILVGISRKRFTAGQTDELEKLAIENGASIVRTHLISEKKW